MCSVTRVTLDNNKERPGRAVTVEPANAAVWTPNDPDLTLVFGLP